MRHFWPSPGVIKRPWPAWGTGWTDDLGSYMTMRAEILGGQRYRFFQWGRLSITWDTKRRRKPPTPVTDVIRTTD